MIIKAMLGNGGFRVFEDAIEVVASHRHDDISVPSKFIDTEIGFEAMEADFDKFAEKIVDKAMGNSSNTTTNMNSVEGPWLNFLIVSPNSDPIAIDYRDGEKLLDSFYKGFKLLHFRCKEGQVTLLSNFPMYLCTDTGDTIETIK